MPVPDGRLWSFRMVTAYGDPDADPVPADVISYLEWCRDTAHASERRATTVGSWQTPVAQARSRNLLRRARRG